MQTKKCQNYPNTQKTTLKQPTFKDLTFLKKVLEQHLFSAEECVFSVSGKRSKALPLTFEVSADVALQFFLLSTKEGLGYITFYTPYNK